MKEKQNNECNLECVKKKDKKADDVVEFVGPVKIILVNRPKVANRHKVWNAAFLALAQMLLAITFFIVALYTLTYKKKGYMKALHIFLCTVGLQLILPMGILSLNNLSGAAAPMTLSDRKFEHGIMQIFGLAVTIAGSISSYESGYDTFLTPHSCLGIAAGCLGILTGLIGPIIYIFSNVMAKDKLRRVVRKFVSIHQVLGILTIVLSSICFLSGISKKSFINWLPFYEIYYCLGVFCVFYTIVIIYKPLHIMN